MRVALWPPHADALTESNIGRFMAWLRDSGVANVNDYDELWAWSVDDVAAFWDCISRYFGVTFGNKPTTVLVGETMPGATWFPGATLNFAEHVLRAENSSRLALVAVGETGDGDAWPWSRLRLEVAAFAQHLRSIGIQPGDRVVGYLPNIPEAVVAFLATSSIGAVWSVCNQDVPTNGVLGRFAQLEPTVLVAADGCRYGGREHDRREVIRELAAALPTLRETVVVTNIGTRATPRTGLVAWDEAITESADLEFAQVGFDHALWVLFSSGTTGLPKGIVHGHGGILLEHLKFHSLHLDLRPGDRFFWHASTTWVMWNVIVSSLLAGATAVLYDGSPAHPKTDRLWEIAQEQSVSFLGVSPAYLLATAKEGAQPRSTYGLEALRTIGCTGSPLPSSGDRWVHQQFDGDVVLNSLSGGTDVAGAFVAGCPLLPVYPGEMGGRCLGVAAEAWNSSGQPVTDEVGELVITRPMPSMPLCFWGDSDGARYRDAYFDTFPGIWRHGDWITITTEGSAIIHGRSDATLNRQGVRLGSAEIYDAVESLPQVQEALVVGVEMPDGGYWMPLFVHLQPDVVLDHALRADIEAAIRTKASPRHVPDETIQVSGVPHTLTGKRLEVPIKRILTGTPITTAVNPNAVDRPELLELFSELSNRRQASRTLRL